MFVCLLICLSSSCFAFDFIFRVLSDLGWEVRRVLWFEWVGLEGKQQKIEFLRYFAAGAATAAAAAAVLLLVLLLFAAILSLFARFCLFLCCYCCGALRGGGCMHAVCPRQQQLQKQQQQQ